MVAVRFCDIEIYPSGNSIWQDKWSEGLVHTNHALTPDWAPQESYVLTDSCRRLDRARQLFQENLGHLSVQVIQEILADHDGQPAGICRHGAEGMYSISVLYSGSGKAVVTCQARVRLQRSMENLRSLKLEVATIDLIGENLDFWNNRLN